MIFEIIKYITIFVTTFFSLSLINLVISFFKALLSNPPVKFELGRRELIYYGICTSFITTVIIYYTT